MKYTHNTVAQFIPIIVIFMLLSYFRELVTFTNTILGKLLAIIIIMFYASMDKFVGLFVCALVIFYYQTDVYENMLNMDTVDTLDIEDSVDIGDTLDNDPVDDYVYLSNEEKEEKLKKEGMIDYVDLYSNDFDKDILFSNEKIQGQFKKEHCDKGKFMNKDLEVKNYEMTEHIFPEIKFRRGFCNPCLKDCDFSIIEQKLNAEEKFRNQ